MQFVAMENKEFINLVNHLFVKVNFIDTNVTQFLQVYFFQNNNPSTISTNYTHMMH